VQLMAHIWNSEEEIGGLAPHHKRAQPEKRIEDLWSDHPSLPRNASEWNEIVDEKTRQSCRGARLPSPWKDQSIGLLKRK
jgi:hypothetical protein